MKAMKVMRSPSQRETQEVADEARRLFFYHPETGLILRKIYWRREDVGKEAGCFCRTSDGQNYRSISILNTRYRSHRIAWLLHYGAWPAIQIDHRDGNGINNRIENLREATSQQNAMNAKMTSRNSSGATGVSFKKTEGKWSASITIHKNKIQLGLYENFEDAVRVRKQAESKYGFSERHGTKADMGSSAESN
jgi:hypothetical protein